VCFAFWTAKEILLAEAQSIFQENSDLAAWRERIVLAKAQRRRVFFKKTATWRLGVKE
jgi:hypothetical protein